MVSFTNPAHFTTGVPPRFTFTGDFNGDGKIDLATTNNDPKNLSVLLGDGSGSFATPATFSTAPILATADVNGDGKTDLLVASATDKVGVLLADGSGGFGTPTTFDAGGEYGSLNVADLNGDGKTDLVVTSASDKFRVLLGNGSGGFGVPTTFDLGDNSFYSHYTLPADINGDGNTDLVALSWGGQTAWVVLGDGRGSFGATASFALPVECRAYSATIGDFNGDGKSDLATANVDLPYHCVMLGNANGGLGNGTLYEAASDFPLGVVAADFDGDGKTDLALESPDFSYIRLLTGDGNGGFAIGPFFEFESRIGSSSNYPINNPLLTTLVMADFNGDGRPDLAARDYTSNAVSVFMNTTGDPVIDPATFTLAENSPDGVLVGTVLATDSNAGDTLTYAITAGNGDSDEDGKAAFSIASGSGKLTVNDRGDLNFETISKFSLTVTATDPQGHTGSGTITVNLTNADEPGNEAPIAQNATFTLAENKADGTVVGTVIVTDIDVGDTLAYGITAGNSDPDKDGKAAFAIDAATGKITVNDSGDLDFETTPAFSLTVKATDAGGLSDSAAVRVDLVNVNELNDNVDQLIFSEATGNAIDHISPMGDDFEPLVSGLSAPVAIAIDPEAGKMYFTEWWSSTEVRRADLDGTHLEDLYPSAGGGGQGIAIDPARNLVFWGEYYNGLYAGSMDGSKAATLLVSSDTLRSAAGASGLDGVGVGLDVDPAAQVVYFFTRDNSSSAGRDIWRVNYDGTGLQKLADLQSTNSMEIDLENRYLYYSDISGGQDQEGMYRMSLDNGVKEHLFDLPATCTSIAIDNASNTLFFITNPGEPADSASLWRSNLDGSGRILLKDNIPGGRSVEFLRGTIYVTPDDFAVAENSPAGTLVGTVSTHGITALSFAITAGNSDPDGDGKAAFGIDHATGKLTVNDAGDFDFETTPRFSLTVVATDAQEKSASGSITVNLANVDEPGNEPPMAQNVAFTLDENKANGTVVGTVAATDIDAGDNLAYGITAGNTDPDKDGKEAFAIDPATGKITVNDNGDLDYETTPAFNLTVKATDAGGLSDTAAVKINLSDVFEREGTPDNDVLTGTEDNDELNGLAGDDTLTGYEGNDTLDGGVGTDRVQEQGDVNFTLTDSQLTGLGTDTLIGIERASLTGGVSENRLDASAYNRGPVVLDGGGGNDTLIGPSMAGSYHLIFGFYYNIFIGGDGNDTLTGGTGIDCVKEWVDEWDNTANLILTDSQLTGRGTDRFSSMELAYLIGSWRDNRLDVSGFTGSLTILEGDWGNDTLVGGAAEDWVRARGNVDFTLTDAHLIGKGTDTLNKMDRAYLTGGGGDNSLDASVFTGELVVLAGGGGNDTLIGRDVGIDRVKAQGNVDFALTNTRLTGRGTDSLSHIDQAELVGGAGNNRIDVSAFTGSLTLLEGGDGDDTLVGRKGGIDQVRARGNVDFTLTNTQLTGLGTDTLIDIDQATLIGDGDRNTLDASAFTQGRVWLYGESGDDILKGGARNDYLSGGVGDDALFGGGGIDRAEGRGDTDFTLTATQLIGLGTDTLNGIEEAYLCGGPRDNVLDASGFTGSLVILEGQSGSDTLIGRSSGVDKVRAQGDVNFVLTDTQLTGLGTDNLTSIEQAELIGNSGDNIFDASAFTRGLVTLSGGGGDDTLIGGREDDSLGGGYGDDILEGGLGKDSLTGDLGVDIFKFVSVTESGITDISRDVIKDFALDQGDKIDLSAIDADTAVAGKQAFVSLTQGGAFSGVFANPADLYFDQLAHILYGNNDADGEADFSIQLTGVSSLNLAAFV